MRVEELLERPFVVEAPVTPAIDDYAGRTLPAQLVRVYGELTFAPGSSALLPPARERLERLVDWLGNQFPEGDYHLEIQGHTDATGSDRGNERLALARAEVVRRYLCGRLALPRARTRLVSAGASSPAGDDRTELGRARNRRVVILVFR